MPDKTLISFELHKTSRCIKRYMDSHTQKSCADKMTGMHGWAIGYFYDHRHEDVFQRDFEKACNIRRSTATSILQLMEKNGLIVRESVPYDARLKKITLTEKALQMHRQVDDAFNALEDKLRSKLSEEETATFFSVLKKIQQEVEADDQTTGPMRPRV